MASLSLDLFNDAPFAFSIIFVIQGEIPLKQSSLGGAILTTLRHDCKNLTYTFIESMNCEREKNWTVNRLLHCMRSFHLDVAHIANLASK